MYPITDEWEEKMQYPYRKDCHSIIQKNASLVAQAVKHLPAMRETGVQSLGRKWQLTPVLLPGKSHGWRSLVGYSPWGRKE